MLVIGIMSGTSLDGIDAALVEFSGRMPDPEWRLVAFESTPYPPEKRARIHEAIATGRAAALCRLNADLGDWFADAALALLTAAGIDRRAVALVGSHGQTIWHEPPRHGERGATLQLGCAATMAERTGIPVVSDFRSRDVAAGGHGAPLVPFADRLLYASPLETRVLVNIGGMANLTRVPPRGSGEPLLAFDTGPGNVLVDAAIELATGGRDTFDRDGGRARQGRIDERLLATLLADPFFASPPPRSTGREHFGRPYVERIAEQAAVHDDSSWDDLIATLTALTARSIAGAIVRWVVPLGADTVILTGGGASNRTLTEMIVERIAPMRVIDAGGAGVHADAKEAIAFAALAWAHVHGVPGNIVEVTGAAGPRILGSLTPA